MKKLFSVFMTLAVALSLAACGSGNSAGESSRGTEPETSVQGIEEQSGTKEDINGTEPSSDAQEPESADEPSTEEPGGTEAKALVVYFSATGNTKAVAETIARLQGTDIYEIVPEQPYTDEDLNYNDRSTRATAEQNDPDVRPAISGGIEDISVYDVVYVGYPNMEQGFLCV